MIKPFDIEQARTSKTLKRACLVLKPCESFNVIGWLRKNFATPECLQEEPGNGAFSEKKSAIRMWEFISFIIRTGAHWTRELDSKFALQRLFLHFYVILYYDSKYNHDFSYPKSKLREMWLNGEFHGLLSLSLGHLCRSTRFSIFFFCDPLPLLSWSLEQLRINYPPRNKRPLTLEKHTIPSSPQCKKKTV